MSTLMGCGAGTKKPSEEGSSDQTTTSTQTEQKDPTVQEPKVVHPERAPEEIPAQILNMTEFRTLAPNRLPANLDDELKAYVEGYTGESSFDANVNVRVSRMKSKKVFLLFKELKLVSGDMSSVFVPDAKADINIFLQGENSLESRTYVIHNQSKMDEETMDFSKCSTLRFYGVEGSESDSLILQRSGWNNRVLVGGRVIVRNCTLDLRGGSLSSYGNVCIEKGGRVIFPDGSQINLSNSVGDDIYFSCDYETKKCTVYSYSDSESISLSLTYSNGKEISLSGKSSELTFTMPGEGISLSTEKEPCSISFVSGEQKIFPTYSSQGYRFLLPTDADFKKLTFELTLGEGYKAKILSKTYSESTTLTLDLSDKDSFDISFISPEGKTKKITYVISLVGVNVLSLDIDESLGSIEAMNGDKEKESCCFGSLTYTATEGKYCFTSYFSIHGRGNATWDDEKKGYALKLHTDGSYSEKNKVDISGMGESASWVLLANHRDRTLMRNALALTLTQKLGMKYAVEFVFVDLYMNGEYLGLYNLAEKIHTSPYQLDIEEAEKDDLSGGYLLEFDNYDDSPQLRLERSGLRVTINSPDNLESYTAIERLLNEAERAIRNENGYNKDTKKYWYDYIDTTSFAQLWMVREYTMDYDATVNFRMYYDPSDGKLHAGPAWDFDNSMARTARQYADPTVALIESGDRDKNCWLTRLMAFDGFKAEIVRLYEENKELFDTESKDSIYSLALNYYDILSPSITANFEKWKFQLYNGSWNTPEDRSYDGHFAILTEFLTGRNKFWKEYIPSL